MLRMDSEDRTHAEIPGFRNRGEILFPDPRDHVPCSRRAFERLDGLAAEGRGPRVAPPVSRDVDRFHALPVRPATNRAPAGGARYLGYFFSAVQMRS